MPDDEITLFNACTDLVSLRKRETFPLHLLGTKRPGEWIRLRDFCLRIGISTGDLRSEVFATWLPDPMAHDEYAVIMFYDDESKWSMAAHYNRGRLVGMTPPTQSLPRTATSSASSCSTSSPETAPAAEL